MAKTKKFAHSTKQERKIARGAAGENLAGGYIRNRDEPHHGKLDEITYSGIHYFDINAL